MSKLSPQNLSAQLLYRGRGNPPSTQPVSAISNCFPGLEFDFRAIWRRMFVGIVLSEHNNYVIDVEDPQHKDLVGHRLLVIENLPTVVQTVGITNPGFPAGVLTSGKNPDGASFMEWSNNLGRFMSAGGRTVRCGFTEACAENELLPPEDLSKLVYRDLELRAFFEASSAGPDEPRQAVIARALAEPGELTQGLCSPWQNDYRECACYYWAASRPDYVNVVDTAEGQTRGENWLAKQPVGFYVLDDRVDPRLVTYDDLFKDWQGLLYFVIGGSNAQDRNDR